MKKQETRAAVIIAILSLAGIIVWFSTGSSKKSKLTFETAIVTKSNISTFVTATGTVEPITKVDVGTQVSGIVDKIFVDYNSPVTKGAILAELDKTNLLNEQASRRSSMATAKTEYEYQLKNYTRMKTLHEKQLIADNEYELAYYTYQQAKNSYDISRNELAKAETNLGYATIYSPIDGVVLSRVVEEGQTVAASFSTPTLFTIAQDLTQMQVVANVDEADIGEVKEGQRVEFAVDAYPNDSFEGEVIQVRQEATVTSNVVTYEVVINSPNPDLKLKPGLTANITIYTAERKGVLSVPVKALRFDPTLLAPDAGFTVADTPAPTKLWVNKGGTINAIPVQTGISGGGRTELLTGIAEGTEILVAAQVSTGKNGHESSGAQSPFMPSPPNSKK